MHDLNTHQRSQISVPSEVVKHMSNQTDVGRYRQVTEGAANNWIGIALSRRCAVSPTVLAPTWNWVATFHIDTGITVALPTSSTPDVPGLSDRPGTQGP